MREGSKKDPCAGGELEGALYGRRVKRSPVREGS